MVHQVQSFLIYDRGPGAALAISKLSSCLGWQIFGQLHTAADLAKTPLHNDGGAAGPNLQLWAYEEHGSY